MREVESSRKRHLRHIRGFLIAGGFAFLVDAAVLMGGVAMGLPVWFARAPSFFAAVLTTWIINRTFTFRTSEPASLKEFTRYIGAMSFGLAVNYGVFLTVLAMSPLAVRIPLLALVPATASGMVVNFLTSRRILDR